MTELQPTGSELDGLIAKLSQDYIAARIARDTQAAAKIRAELDLLVAMRDAGL